MENICFYYLPDTRFSGKGCCAYEGFQKMVPHPQIANRWILHPTKNPIDHPIIVDELHCRNKALCSRYTASVLSLYDCV
jgi:hypothetical protein